MHSLLKRFPAFRALTVGSASHFFSSITNFVFNLYLIRKLTTEDYGTFLIFFSIIIFFSGISNSLFLIQMIVTSGQKSRVEKISFAGRILFLVLVFCLISTISLVIICVSISHIMHINVSSSEMFFVCASMNLVMIKEFYIKTLFNIKNEKGALYTNVIFCMANVSAILAFRSIEFDLSIALQIYSASLAFAVATAAMISSVTVRQHSLAEVAGDFRSIISGGSWASLSHLMYFAREQSYTLIVGLTIGAAGVAQLGATRLLVAPAALILPPVGNIVLPRLAELRRRKDGIQRIYSRGLQITSILTMTSILYGVFVTIFYPTLAEMVLGQSYANLQVMGSFWVVIIILLSTRTGLTFMEQVKGKFRSLARIDASGAIVSVSSTYLFALSFGASGALVGVILGYGVSCALLIRSVLKEKPY